MVLTMIFQKRLMHLNKKTVCQCRKEQKDQKMIETNKDMK